MCEQKSWPSEQYLRQHNRSPFDAIKQLDQVRQHVLGADSELILVGLSIGASLALGYTLAHPQHVDGLVLAAGGLRGFEFDNDLREEALFDHAENLIGDVHGLANLLVRIWGDGPLQDPGRLADDIVDRMLKWNIDIASREGQKVGGNALDAVRHEPPPIARLHTIDVPTAVAWGVFDESYTTAAMKYVANHVEAATSKEFKTAHMINLESPDEFNRWLNEWLQSNFET